MVRDFLSAVRFLTTIPLPQGKGESPAFGRLGVWFPLTGALIGLLLLVADSVCALFLPDLLRSALVLALWALLTGGLHLDGLGDCCDAFFAPVSTERRLEILKDVHMGAFGVGGLTLTLLVKLSALAALNPMHAPGIDPDLRWGLLLAPVLARWTVLIAAVRPRARPDGMGAAFGRDLNAASIALAGILPLGLVIWLGMPAAAATGVLVLGVVGICIWSQRKIGGVTGDVLGLAIEWGETLVLVALAATIGR